jgi:hypothetical protein
MDSMQRVAIINGSSLPTFGKCGDWSAVETPRADMTKGTGPTAAGANFLLALKAMVEMAGALDEHADMKAPCSFFGRGFALEDAIGSHTCSLEASMHVTNNFPLGLGRPLPLTVATISIATKHKRHTSKN